MNFTAIDYVKIAVANAYGMDRKPWLERIHWVDAQEDLYEMVPEAKEPNLMLKAINALEDAKEGIPSGFIMGLDSTASGIQLMACLTGCYETASRVNLVNTGNREDVYESIAKTMNMSRDVLKLPLMTTFYGSTRQPEEIFGEGTPELDLFYKTLNKALPGAMDYMETVQGCWDRNATEYSWRMPDGFHVVMPVTAVVGHKIEVDELDHITFTYNMEVKRPKKKGRALAANVIHSVDSYVCREMYRRCDFDILTIHDSYWCHPNDMNELRRHYREILADIAKSNLLESILQQIINNPSLKVLKDGDLSAYILASEYALS
jgi:DNA-directed RNA polymerase